MGCHLVLSTTASNHRVEPVTSQRIGPLETIHSSNMKGRFVLGQCSPCLQCFTRNGRSLFSFCTHKVLDKRNKQCARVGVSACPNRASALVGLLVVVQCHDVVDVIGRLWLQMDQRIINFGSHLLGAC